jgi:dihydropteroate synthase
MGILNVTPDSFFDGNRYFETRKAVEYALLMIEEGADIIDVGGESTRPFTRPVPLHDELERVIPVIEGIRERSDVLISIDTYKSPVARKACEAGADIVNDISGLRFDGDMAETVAGLGAYLVIMHMKGKPEDMQNDPCYDDVIGEIKMFFEERIGFAKSVGISEDKIIIDPGIGFGKRVEDNLKIIGNIGEFKRTGRPLLIGTSMKNFVGRVTGASLEERREGTLASAAIAVWNGADIVRVHDVKGTAKAVKLVYAVMRA